jgi:hypothetical protein
MKRGTNNKETELGADKTDTNKRLMLESLKSNLGIVSKSCESVNISRDTHYRWLKEDKAYSESVYAITERSIDFAEGQLFNLMAGSKRQVVTNRGAVVEIKDGPNATAIIFYLKTKGKNRGYVEKIEQELSLSEGLSDMIFSVKRRELE